MSHGSSMYEKAVLMAFSMEPGVAYGTWHLVCAAIGSARAAEVGPDRARMLCRRAFRVAERFGLVRRLPTRMASSVPASLSKKFEFKIDKELSWCLGEAGEELLALGDPHLAMARFTNQGGTGGPRMASKTEKTKKTQKAEKTEKKVDKKVELKPACKHTCDKPCEKTCKEAKAINKDKIVETVKKIPQWLARMQSELEKLIERLQKLDAALTKALEPFGGEISWNTVRKVRGTKEAVRSAQLMMKQRQAMVAYRDALKARIDFFKEAQGL